MAKHLYRTRAVEEAREAGYVGFRTLPSGEGMWKAIYEPGDNPADAYAKAHPDWCSHGEISWASASSGDEDPWRVGVLICTCTYDTLVRMGTLTVDRKLARIWIKPHDWPADAPFLAEQMDGERWGFFTPKPGTASEGKPTPFPVAAPPARPARSAATATAPIVQRSTVDSPTKRVWAIADGMPGATRAEIVAACVAEGINKSTAGTQYFHWNTARKAKEGNP
jgi:hypothetical protein